MNKGFRDASKLFAYVTKMDISWYVIGFFNSQISQFGSTTCPHLYLFIQNKMSLFFFCLFLTSFSALRWWVFIWTTGGWIAGWAWVCCFSMPSSCSAPSSSGRCEALRSKVDPIRQHAEYLPFYRASSFLKPCRVPRESFCAAL